MKLHISDQLSLPLDAVTQAIGVLAKRRVGKSYLARRFAEELLKAKQQVVIVDPKGDWWGIRSAADGKAPGFPVVILGGQRGDAPLEISAGETVAELIAKEQVSVLLDISGFSKGKVPVFMAAFLEHLYWLKNQEQYRTPLMLIVDEADAIAPQQPMKGEERMLGAAEDIVRRGGQRGLGCMMVTQRSAVLNKNVLTQVEVMIALRTIAPQDLKAMNAWIDVHGTQEERDTLMQSLPSLPVGDAWFWSPGWPTDKGIFQRVHVSPIETFDSGATPRPGEKRKEPKTIADIDIEVLKRQMAATIEQAEANDPKRLRQKIAELQKQLAARPEKKPEVHIVEKPVLKEGQLARIEKAIEKAQGLMNGQLAALNLELGNLRETIKPAFTLQNAPKPPPCLTRHTSQATTPKPAAKLVTPIGSLNKAQRMFLTVLADRAGRPTTRNQVAVFTGYSATSSHVDNVLSSLRTGGLISGASDGLAITADGLKELGEYEPLPTGSELLRHWLQKLPSGPSKMLGVLAEFYPAALTRNEIAEKSGYSPSSSHVDNCLSALRTRELIEGRSDAISASPELFD